MLLHMSRRFCREQKALKLGVPFQMKFFRLHSEKETTIHHCERDSDVGGSTYAADISRSKVDLTHFHPIAYGPADLFSRAFSKNANFWSFLAIWRESNCNCSCSSTCFDLAKLSVTVRCFFSSTYLVT